MVLIPIIIMITHLMYKHAIFSRDYNRGREPMLHIRERAPDLGSRAAESSAPHGAEAGGGHGGVDGGRRSEGAGWDGSMETI